MRSAGRRGLEVHLAMGAILCVEEIRSPQTLEMKVAFHVVSYVTESLNSRRAKRTRKLEQGIEGTSEHLVLVYPRISMAKAPSFEESVSGLRLTVFLPSFARVYCCFHLWVVPA